MSVAALRVLQWIWKLSPAESQAAEYRSVMGDEAFRRQWCGNKRSLRNIEKNRRTT